MGERFRAKIQNFLRGAGSVIDLQPHTRQKHAQEKLKFKRSVFIGGRKYELDAKREPLMQIKDVLASDWKKVAGGISRSAHQLSESQPNGNRLTVKR